MIEYCICGHSDWDHNLSYTAKAFYCNGCVSRYGSAKDQTWHPYKLDNLRLIEDLAKEKGLV